MTGLAGWEGALSGPSHPYSCTSVVCLRSSSQQNPNQHLPASHRLYINRRDRGCSAGCFAFSPLCRGVSHQLALDRPGRESERPEALRIQAAHAVADRTVDSTPHMMD